MADEPPDDPHAAALSEHRARVWDLVGDYGPDIVELCRASATLIPGFTGIGLSTSNARSDPRVRFTSDETSSSLEDFQRDFDEGPCRDAAGSRQPVVAADLTAASWRRRWPRFTPAALNVGVHAVLALPLHAGGVHHEGALDLYRRSPGGWHDGERTAASAFAAAATELLTLEDLDLRLTGAFGDTPETDAPEPPLACWFDFDTLPRVRGQVREIGARHGLSDTELYEFVLAVHEAATNVVRHGGGHGQLLLWRRGDHLWCEVTDHGPGIPANVLPIRQPGTEEPDHRGLWIIRRICTSSKLTTDATGTRLLLSYRLHPPPP